MTMANGEQVYRQRELVDGNLQTKMAEFAAASSIIGQVLSAHTFGASGGLAIAAVGASNNVRLRIENVHISNREASYILIEFRDGSHVGPRVLGPVQVGPFADRGFTRDELMGVAVTSSFVAQAISGGVAFPVSNGIFVRLGFVPEHLDFRD